MCPDTFEAVRLEALQSLHINCQRSGWESPIPHWPSSETRAAPASCHLHSSSHIYLWVFHFSFEDIFGRYRLVSTNIRGTGSSIGLNSNKQAHNSSTMLVSRQFKYTTVSSNPPKDELIRKWNRTIKSCDRSTALQSLLFAACNTGYASLFSRIQPIRGFHHSFEQTHMLPYRKLTRRTPSLHWGRYESIACEHGLVANGSLHLWVTCVMCQPWQLTRCICEYALFSGRFAWRTPRINVMCVWLHVISSPLLHWNQTKVRHKLVSNLRLTSSYPTWDCTNDLRIWMQEDYRGESICCMYYNQHVVWMLWLYCKFTCSNQSQI